MKDLQKRTWAEISLENIRHNYRAIRSSLPLGCRFLGVVKADAYGHGALRVSQLLQEEGVDYLAVSCLDEAMELRQGGISLPILILGHTPPEYTAQLVSLDITQTVTCYAKALEYSAAAAGLGRELKIHIKLDTGMSRLGYLCAGEHFDEGVENIIESCRLPGLVHEGIYTHFAVSDQEDEESREYTRQQFKLFVDVLTAVEQRSGISFPPAPLRKQRGRGELPGDSSGHGTSRPAALRLWGRRETGPAPLHAPGDHREHHQVL